MTDRFSTTDDHTTDLALALGARIRAARQARSMSQTDLAHAVDQPQTSISAYERGARLPDAAQLDALARALGVTVGSLMGEPTPPALDTLSVPGYHVALGGVDVSDLPLRTQSEIASVVRFLVLLARARAGADLNADPSLRVLPAIQNLLAGQPRNPHDRRFRRRNTG